MNDTVRRIGAEDKVKNALKKGQLEDIILMTVDDSGKINIIRRKNGG